MSLPLDAKRVLLHCGFEHIAPRQRFREAEQRIAGDGVADPVRESLMRLRESRLAKFPL
jgi:hypothetical protein